VSSRTISIIGLALLVVGCSGSSVPPEPPLPPITREAHYEPPYAATSLTQTPDTYPAEVSENTPLLSPTFDLQLRSASLSEALQALAQSIGYGVNVPASVANRRVSVVQVGTVVELLESVAQQGRVTAELDHDARRVRVYDSSTIPKLPGPAS